MKWRLIIPIWTFACITFSSSFPIFLQDEMSVMYPIEYYPAYMQSDFLNLNFTKWFKQAADSVKHFYNYVNNLIFGVVARNPIFGRYSIFKHNIPVADTVHSPAPESNVEGIQAFEIYKDSDGNMYVKNLQDPNGELKLLQKISINSGTEVQKPDSSSVKEDPQVKTTTIPRNPFRWNENLEHDKLFSGLFQNYAVNPQLLWHSGILPFQPLSALIMGGKVLDQNQPTQPPAIASDKSQNSEISSQKIVQDEPSSTSTGQPEIIINEESESSSASPTESPEAESTTINEESKNDETSDSSNSSADEKLSSDESSPYEIDMSIERIPQNNSDSDESNQANRSKPETTEGSDIFDETNDEDGDNNDTDTNNDDDDDDEDGNLTEFETDQVSNDDESDQQSQEPETTEKLTVEVTNDENTSENGDNDLTIIETSEPSEANEKAEVIEETTVTKNTENKLSKEDSDESDIVKRVLAIVNPSKN